MRTAVNAPVAVPEFNLGSMNYILAHEALASETYYRNNMGKVRPKKYTILDNGADELGTGLQGEQLFELAGMMGPNELILPDVLKDWAATQENSMKFLEDYGDNLVMTSFMGVCQGRTREEFMNSFYYWLNEPRVNVLGIPYDIDFEVNVDSFSEYQDISDLGDKNLRSRLRGQRRYGLIASLAQLGILTKPVHLLGYNTLDEMRKFSALNHPKVRSTDSTAPFAAACDGRLELGPKDWPTVSFHEGQFDIGNLMCLLNSYFAAAGDESALTNLVRFVGDLPLNWTPNIMNQRLHYYGKAETEFFG